MAVNFIENKDGQLSFFEESNNLIEKEQNDPIIIEFIKKKIKSFHSKISFFEKYKNDKDLSIVEKLKKDLKNDYDEFISSFTLMYQELSMEELLFIQENYASEYHKLCKLLLEYLNRYVYSIGAGNKLDDTTIIQIENLVLMDQVAFRDAYYKEIKATIENRNKLRLNNYLVFDGEALLKRLNSMITREEQNSATKDLNKDITALVTNNSLNEIFYKLDSDFVLEEQKGTLSMLLLYYLERCVYHVIVPNKEVSSKMIEKIELFIVYNFSNKFELNIGQKRTYEIVKTHVSKKLSSYIMRESERLKKCLNDFEKLEAFKNSKKYRLVEQTEDLEDFPQSISEGELKLLLENFLNTVFMLRGNLKKDNLPIFLEEMEEERHLSMELALEYLRLFVYKFANIENEMIFTLEDYIFAERSFHVSNSNLSLVKSKLYSRTGRRNVALEAEKQRKLLQTENN